MYFTPFLSAKTSSIYRWRVRMFVLSEFASKGLSEMLSDETTFTMGQLTKAGVQFHRLLLNAMTSFGDLQELLGELSSSLPAQPSPSPPPSLLAESVVIR